MSSEMMDSRLNRRERRKLRPTRKSGALMLAAALSLGAVVGGGTVFQPTAANAVSLDAGIWFGGDVGAGSFRHANGNQVYCGELGKATVMGNNPAMGATSTLPAYNVASFMISGQTFTNVGTGALSGDALKQFNYVLARYGATADNAQAGAVQIALWKIRAAGSTAGYQDALAFMEQGVGAGVVAQANNMISEAQAASSTTTAPPSDLQVTVTGSYQGYVTADPGTTSLKIENGVFTSSGTDTLTFPGGLAAATNVPFQGRPPADLESWDRYYEVRVSGTYEYETPGSSVQYGTPGGLGQGLVYSTPPEKRTGEFDAVVVDPDTVWSPIVTTQVPSKKLKKGEPFLDTVIFDVAEGSNPWRKAFMADGSERFAPITANCTVYGGYLQDPALNPSATPPVGAPVAGSFSVTTDTVEGPGAYEVASAPLAPEPGYYTASCEIDFADQLASVQDPGTGTPSLPVNYYYIDGFGLVDETAAVPTELSLSTQLKDNDITLDELTLQDVVTPTLVEGGWLQGEGGRHTAKVRLTAYGQTGDVVKQPGAPADAQEIGRVLVDVNEPKQGVESPEIPISLEDFRAFDGGAVQACILDEDQPEELRGLFVETCDEYGADGEVFTFTKPSITTQAQEQGSLGGEIRDTAIVSGSDLPEGSTIGATAYLRPVAGHEKYDENWQPILGEDGEPQLWTQEEIDAIPADAICEVQPVGTTDRIPAKEQGEYELPAIEVGSEGSGIDWVEDTIIPHPETGEDVEWSRGKCGVENEYTDLPEPKVTTEVHLPEAFPEDENWDNVIVTDLADVTDEGKFEYETVVDAFESDADATPTCDVDDKVWTSDPIEVTGSGTFPTNSYVLSDVITKTEGRLDHVEQLIRIDKETEERTVIATGKCGAASEVTMFKTPTPVEKVVHDTLAVTGGAGMLPFLGGGLALLGAGAALFFIRRSRANIAEATVSAE